MNDTLLAWRSGALGDFVATLPALRAFRHQHGNAPLHLITRPAYGRLAVELGVAQGWTSVESPWLLELEKAEAGMLLVDLALHSHCLAWFPDATSMLATNLRRAFGSRVEIRSSLIREKGSVPAWRQLLGGSEACKMPCLLAASASPLLAIHPGSGGKSKNMPLAFWEQRIAETPADWKIAIILGEVEMESPTAAWAAALLANDARVCLWRDLTLTQLAARLCTASAFSGNDSGVGHLAAGLGVPCTIYFRKENFDVWTPYGPQVSHVLVHNGA